MFQKQKLELQDDKDAGFTISFNAQLMFRDCEDDTSQQQKFLDFFKEHGFVVISHVFTPTECCNTRSAMWKILESSNNKFVHTDPSTWGEFKSTGKYGLSTRGPSFDTTLVQNRQNPLLSRALSLLVGVEEERDLMVSHDRYTVYRSTLFDDPAITNGKDFSTGRRNVHLDLNPWWWGEASDDIVFGADSLQYCDPQDFIKENNLVVSSMGSHVQCVLNFADNREEDGGTIVVPGFHKCIDEWAAENVSSRRPLPWVEFSAEQEEVLLSQAYRVSMREGSVLVWHQTVAHGTSPNNSTRCRLAQYLKAFSRSAVFSQLPRSRQSLPSGTAPKKWEKKAKGGKQSKSTDISGSSSGASSSDAQAQQSVASHECEEGEALVASVFKCEKVVEATVETTVDLQCVSDLSISATPTPANYDYHQNPRLVRRAVALKCLLEQSGALSSVSPLGRFLFGLDVLPAEATAAQCTNE